MGQVADAGTQEPGQDSDLTEDELYHALYHPGGRNRAPERLWDLYIAGRVPRSLLPGAVSEAWSAAEFPEFALSRNAWFCLFFRAGYTHDGNPADRPEKPVTLYRGCSQYYTRRMAWTSDRDRAEWFAGYRNHGGHPRAVYQATVEPGRLLAFIGADAGRDENEYVLDPTGPGFRPNRLARFAEASVS
jgi:hypothetical protein